MARLAQSSCPPWGQSGIGVSLILGLLTRFGAAMGTLMMLLFFVGAWELPVRDREPAPDLRAGHVLPQPHRIGQLLGVGRRRSVRASDRASVDGSSRATCIGPVETTTVPPPGPRGCLTTHQELLT